MKLAVSNIAWTPEADADVAGLLEELGIQGVEIAPTKLWPSLTAVDASVIAYRQLWEQRGLTVVALQSLLFGRPDLRVFGTAAERRRTLDHLHTVMRIGRLLGAGPLVFGSPKNRATHGLHPAEVESIAVEFFREAGRMAAELGVVLCIEPNPPRYDCDFVNTAEQGRRLVEMVASPGFGLHLDAAALTLSGEHLEASIAASSLLLRHFHASEPELRPLGMGGVDHAAAAAALRSCGYSNWVSLEMRHDPSRPLLDELRRVVTLLNHHYGD